MVTSRQRTAKSTRGTAGAVAWALDQVLRPTLERGLDEKWIQLPSRWRGDEYMAAMRRLFILEMEGFHNRVEGLHGSVGLNLNEIASRLRVSSSRVGRLLSTIEDWHWFTASLRLAASDKGVLPLSNSVLMMKSAPVSLTGSNIFGVASRRWPDIVIDALGGGAGLPAAASLPPNGVATDNSLWLVEAHPSWTLTLQLHPILEGTWFDFSRYDEHWYEAARAALQDFHGEYEVSTAEIVRQAIDAFEVALDSFGRTDGRGMPVESGCVQYDLLGAETFFVGGRLDLVERIRRQGFSPFFDLPRLRPATLSRRGASTCAPWSGRVSMGTETCSFEDDDGQSRSSLEMNWAAHQTVLKKKVRPKQLRRIFRVAQDSAMREMTDDPAGVRYVVAHARVGKEGAPRSERVPIGLLVRDYLGEVSSGWGVTEADGDIRETGVQKAVIERAELHLKRAMPRGQFGEMVKYHRAAGVHTTGARKRQRLHERHGLKLAADVVLTRALIGV